jgi:hypothetical protein
MLSLPLEFLCRIPETHTPDGVVRKAKRALKELDSYVCPHFRTSSPAFFDCLDLVRLYKPRRLWERRRPSMKCSGKDCDAKVTFYYHENTRVYIAVERKLGLLRESMDKVWLAQLEAPN